MPSRDWAHENRLRAIHGHRQRRLCPECGAPTRSEPGDAYAPRVRSCGGCGWDDYQDQLDLSLARAGECALYGDAHTADT